MRKRITFVGSGTPDPQLLTMRAIDAIRAARTIVADAEAEVLAQAWMAPDTRVVLLDVDLSFAQRMRLIKDELAAHPDLVRLIGGDPVVDGVLANELEALAAVAHLAVVPGITSAANAAAYSGISLTGNRARELRVVEADDPGVEWAGRARETLVVKGAGRNLEHVFESLVASGRELTTPFRIVCGGGSPDQRTSSGTLGEYREVLQRMQTTADSVLFVGEIVRHGNEWFERLPLFGWRVLVPRTKDSLADVIGELEREGAVTTPVSTLSVEPPRTQAQMERAFAGLAEGRYGWIVFTCANAFTAVWGKCRERGLDARVFAGTQLAAVGEDTLEAMAAAGLRPELVPGRVHTSQALLEVFPDAGTGAEAMNRVLVPRADIATETLASGLTELGWEVDEVMAFRTVRSAPPAVEVREAIKAGGFDAVVFTSSATVRNLIGLAGKPHPQTVVACIGAGTARAAEEHGLRVDVIAAEPTHAALVEALVAYGESRARDVASGVVEIARPSLQRGSARRKAK
jgi:uroporphyrinogen III methyltransferase/synthase